MATLEELEAQLAEMRKLIEAQTKRAAEADMQRQKESLRNGVREALIAQGADPRRVHLALPVLQSSGRVKLDGNGEPVFVFPERSGSPEMSAAEGAKRWLSTEDGKFFLPGASGQEIGGDKMAPNQELLNIVSRALGGL